MKEIHKGSREWLQNATKEEVMALPWDHPGVIVVPGRYYYGQVNIFVPPTALTPKGADVMGCLWRFDNNPVEWYFTYRLRIYRDEKVADSDDIKLWRVEKILAVSEAEAVEAINRLGILANFPDPDRILWVIVQGDCEKFGKAMEEKAKTVNYLHREILPERK